MRERDIEWIDDWDCKHIMSIEAATEFLKEFWNEWPGGLEEIDACITYWHLKAIDAKAKLKKEGIE